MNCLNSSLVGDKVTVEGVVARAGSKVGSRKVDIRESLLTMKALKEILASSSLAILINGGF